jgi:uncharacterized membrane protein YcaP (DUF421 family)
MWFDTTSQVVRTLLVGLATYATLVVLLRVSGKRTLAKLNAFDLVVTVALGSTLASVLLSGTVAYVEGLAALVLLVVLQLVVAGVAAWVPGGHRLLTSRPRLLLADGVMDETAMRRSRVAPDEVRQAVRSSGQGDLGQISAVVLETDGTLSVVPRSTAGGGSALRNVS